MIFALHPLPLAHCLPKTFLLQATCGQKKMNFELLKENTVYKHGLDANQVNALSDRYPLRTQTLEFTLVPRHSPLSATSGMCWKVLTMKSDRYGSRTLCDRAFENFVLPSLPAALSPLCMGSLEVACRRFRVITPAHHCQHGPGAGALL